VGAPEAVQASVAAGLLGAGSVYLGATQNVAELLGPLIEEVRAGKSLELVAAEQVRRSLAEKRKIPGFGHPIHKPVDPRAVALFDVARSTGYFGDACKLMELMHSEMERQLNRRITLNAGGASGAVMMELGIEPEVMRLVKISARAIGLIAHIREELHHPVADDIWNLVMDNTVYEPGDA
jgi:citrate synthase